MVSIHHLDAVLDTDMHLRLSQLLLLGVGIVWGLSTPKDGAIIPANANLTEIIESDPSSLVNLFIGTTNGGHSFPGATLPHGMIKVGLDTDSPGNVSTSSLLKPISHYRLSV